MSIKNQRRYLLGSLLCLSFHSSASWAQAAAATSADQGVGEIVVTATKRSENLQKVPIAISALSGDQLAKQGITNVTGVASQVPNLQITTPYSEAVPIFSLRGISAVDFSQNQSSPIALYVNEDYKGVPVFTSLQLFDVERVEVLRGPQGTLFGKNTTGGAVSVTTKSPDLSAGFTGNITAGYGRFNRFELAGGVNIPIVDDKVAGRIAFTRTVADGYVKSLFADGADQSSTRDWAVRGSFTAKLADRLKIMLHYTHSESAPTGYGVLATDIGPGGQGFFTGYDRSGLGFFENEADTNGFLRIRNDSSSLRADWDVSDTVAVTSLTTFNSGRWDTLEDGDGGPFDILTDRYLSSAKAFSQDLRLASTENSPLKWLVGAYFYWDDVRSSVNNNYYFAFAGDGDGNGQLDCFDDGFTGCGYTNDLRQIRKSLAIYTNNDYRFDSGLTITFGVRFTHDDNRLDRYTSSLSYLDPATGTVVLNAAQAFNTPPINQLKSDNLSGKIGVSYETRGGGLLYASVSRGYRGGAFNGQALFSPAEVTIARPELLYAYEVGTKLQSSDRRFRLNTSAFFYNYLNQQFIDVTPQLLQVLYNAPRSHLWGLEAEFTARPVESLTIRLGGSYLNAKYKENFLQGQDLSGRTLIMAPKWTITGGVDWTIVDGSFGKVALHTDHRYTSKLYFDAFNSDKISQDGYWIHDARVSYSTANNALEIAGWVRNIGNKTYKTYALETSDGFNFNYAQRGRPREYGVQATYRF
ncbi:MAG: hypothetical protein RL268_568 [Pseudomonadota bacterium]